MRILFSFLTILLYVKNASAGSLCNQVEVPSIIRVVVPAAPGNSSDTTARLLNARIQELFQKIGAKTSVIVENKPGGSGTIGAAALLNDSPSKLSSGATLIFAQAPDIVVNPHYEPIHAKYQSSDFAPVAYVGSTHYGLICSTKPELKSVKNINDFIQYAKDHKVSYGTGGSTNFTNLLMVKLAQSAGIKYGLEKGLAEIPFQGTSPAQRELVGGHTDCMFQSSASIKSLLKATEPQVKLVGSALTTFHHTKEWSKDGNKLISEAISETVPGFGEPLNWSGYLGHKSLNPKFAACFNEIARAAIRDQEVSAKLKKNGILTAGIDIGPKEFAKLVSDSERELIPLIKTVGQISKAEGVYSFPVIPAAAAVESAKQ